LAPLFTCGPHNIQLAVTGIRSWEKLQIRANERHVSYFEEQKGPSYGFIVEDELAISLRIVLRHPVEVL
jgi:hypothetical protein